MVNHLTRLGLVQVETLRGALYVAAEERALEGMGLGGLEGEDLYEGLETVAEAAREDAEAEGVIGKEGEEEEGVERKGDEEDREGGTGLTEMEEEAEEDVTRAVEAMRRSSGLVIDKKGNARRRGHA